MARQSAVDSIFTTEKSSPMTRTIPLLYYLPSPVLTVEETARWLQVHISTIYKLLRAHAIPAWKIGSDWRFNVEHLRHWLDQLLIAWAKEHG